MTKNRIQNKIYKLICVVLLLSMLLVSAVSCAKNLGKPMMTLGDTVITENMFMLYLSRAKGSAVYASSDAKNDKFWDILVTEDGDTYDDMYKDLVLESAKNTLAAVYLFIFFFCYLLTFPATFNTSHVLANGGA